MAQDNAYKIWKAVTESDLVSLFIKTWFAYEYIYLFLITVLEQQGSNFNFNREINDIRIKKMRVMLPVTDDGKPDFQFMEDYIRELMTTKREQYRAYVEKRLEALKLADSNGGGYSKLLKTRQWKSFIIKDIADVYSGHDI